MDTERIKGILKKIWSRNPAQFEKFNNREKTNLERYGYKCVLSSIIREEIKRQTLLDMVIHHL
jgi:hypothetical protein